MSDTATFDRVLSTLEPRLNQTGDIKTSEVWKLCHFANYQQVTMCFREIMSVMVSLHKAVKVRQGTWNILKPNEHEALSEDESACAELYGGNNYKESYSHS